MKPGVDYIGVTTVFFCHDGKGNLLLHKRSKKCRDEKGKWDVGGGTMRRGETFEGCVRREIKEEYKAKIIKLTFVRVNNVIRDNDGVLTHWVALLFSVVIDPKTAKIGEPKKMDEIGWFKINKLPKPLHSMLRTHLKMVRQAKSI